jgi:putative ABC transport system permease protein
VTRFANLTIAGGDTAAIARFAQSESGVAHVEQRTVADLPIRLPGTRMLGRVVGLPGNPPEVNQPKVLSGNLPAPGEVALESHLADHFHLEAGDTIEVLGRSGWRTATVSGVMSSPEYIWPARNRQEVLTTPDNFGVVFAPESDVREVVGSGPNEMVAYYTDGAPNPELTAAIEAKATGAVDVYTRADQPSNAALEEDLAGFQELSLFFPILFLAAAGMAGYVMITRLVHAQRPQVGILVANGFTRRQVLVHYLGFGLVPGLAGAIPGAVTGMFLARVITRLYTTMISVPVTVVKVHPTTLAIAIGLGVFVSVMAAFGPARAAAATIPAASMRGTVPVGGGRRSLFERYLPFTRRLPIRLRMGLRGIERNPRRTVSTVLGVVLSLVLVLVSWGMLDTIQVLLGRQFDQIDRQDAQVYFEGPVDVASVAGLTSVAGVAAAEPTTQLPATVGIGADTVSSAVVGLVANTTMHTFFTPDGAKIPLPTNGALVASSVLDQTGVSIGDTIDITVQGAGAFGVTVAGSIDEPLGSFVYVSLDQMQTAAGGRLPITSALVRYDPGVDPSSVRSALLAQPGIAAFEDTNALAETMRGFMGLFYGFVGVMLAFGAAMAFALIFNAMSVNIAERTREVGTLLAVGIERRTVSRLITVENLTLVALGIPVGLLAGYLVSAAAMKSFQSDMFRLDLHMRVTTFVFSGLAILLVTLLSQRPGLKAIKRMNVARIIKDRSL